MNNKTNEACFTDWQIFFVSILDAGKILDYTNSYEKQILFIFTSNSVQILNKISYIFYAIFIGLITFPLHISSYRIANHPGN